MFHISGWWSFRARISGLYHSTRKNEPKWCQWVCVQGLPRVRFRFGLPRKAMERLCKSLLLQHKFFRRHSASRMECMEFCWPRVSFAQPQPLICLKKKKKKILVWAIKCVDKNLLSRTSWMISRRKFYKLFCSNIYFLSNTIEVSWFVMRIIYNFQDVDFYTGKFLNS